MSFSGDRPVVEEIEVDSSGSRLAIPQGLTVDVNQQSAYLIMGLASSSQGYSSRMVRVDPSGTMFVTGSVKVSEPVFAFTFTQGVFQTGSLASAQNPVQLGAIDPQNQLRNVLCDSSGRLIVAIDQEPTFFFQAPDVAVTAGKSMISILNLSTRTVKVKEIKVINTRTASLTGVIGIFEIRRIASHSGGSLVTGECADTGDAALTGSITVRTGAVVSGESAAVAMRSLWSTDEWGPGTGDVESFDHVIQQTFPIYHQNNLSSKPFVLRQNQGLTLKQTTANAGTFDVQLIISVV